LVFRLSWNFASTFCSCCGVSTVFKGLGLCGCAFWLLVANTGSRYSGL